MANSCIPLGHLKADYCTNTIVVHLLRFWEARNVKKGSELMGSTLIQGYKQTSVEHLSTTQ
ncbi:unnamed protein product [Brassica oleracea]